MAAGCVNVAEVWVLHPFASVMVTMYVPALKPEAVAVVCTGYEFQL